MTQGNLYVLAGPSGVGKGTVVKALQAKHADVYVAISATTRPRRDYEIDGKDYYFISEQSFSEIIEEDGFLEWALVHKKYRYGTLAKPVKAQVEKGNAVLLEIDLAGARQIKEKFPRAHFIFLMPPSIDELMKRLVGRGTEDEEAIARRMHTAEKELAAVEEFDSVILNDDVQRASQELARIIGIS